MWNKMKISGTQLSRDKLFRKSTDLKDATTAWKVSKYGIFSGTYFPVFGLNIRKYETEKSPYLDTFHAVYFTNS